MGRWFDVYAYRIGGPGSRRVALLFRDVTAARKLAEERERLLEAERVARGEAERVSRMKDEFLATLSHELRTPLNAILGWTQIVARHPGDAPTVAEGLDTIQRNARAQAQIIEDLLDMSRIIAGKVRLDVESVWPGLSNPSCR
jgi:signal transduction histidine kinase